MSRIIINNKSKLSDMDVTLRVWSVIKDGKTSKYYGTFGYRRDRTFDDCYVECDLTRNGTHTFTVTDK